MDGLVFIKRKIICMVLLLSLVVCSAGGFAQAVHAQTNDATEVCVVYDNSASMSRKPEMLEMMQRFCEVLAATLDYGNGDRMSIFPMWELSPGSGAFISKTEKILIESADEVDKIAGIEISYTGSTLFSTVHSAYQYLVNNSPASQKVLVVLSDGVFEDCSNIQLEFEKMIAHSAVKIVYISNQEETTSEASHVNADPAKGLFVCRASDLYDMDHVFGAVLGICCGYMAIDVVDSTAEGNQITLSVQDCDRLIVIAQGMELCADVLQSPSGEVVTADYVRSRLGGDLCVNIFERCAAGAYVLGAGAAKKLIVLQDPLPAEQPAEPTENSELIEKLEDIQEEIGRTDRTYDILFWIQTALLILALIVAGIIIFSNNEDETENALPVTEKNRYPDVFISYKSERQKETKFIRDKLAENGISCWMAPESIPAGSNYTIEIPAAIKNCKVFVVVLSREVASSQWVPLEIVRACECGKKIIPYLLEAFELEENISFMLATSQQIQAYKKSRVDAVNELLTTIQNDLQSK